MQCLGLRPSEAALAIPKPGLWFHHEVEKVWVTDPVRLGVSNASTSTIEPFSAKEQSREGVMNLKLMIVPIESRANSEGCIASMMIFSVFHPGG